MTDIKAIETRYNGYRFRSRLEARWAVFFDKMGIEYIYELDGFERTLDGGETIRYLPDFYFPKCGLFGEVKGVANRGQLSEEDLDKLYWMIDFDGPCARGIVMLGDIPYSPFARSMAWAIWKHKEETTLWGYAVGDEPTNDIDHSLPTDYISCEPIRFADDMRLTICGEDMCHTDYQLRTALMAARSARFEHGEGATV